MRQVVFATNNPHKLAEVRAIIDQECTHRDFEVLSLEDIRFCIDIPETSDTLEGNAIQKARFIRNHTGLHCFADDTGLEIPALNGEPGVRSARYAGEKANSSRNVRKVLRKLEGKKNRKARFRTVIALVVNDKEYIFEGAVQGTILEAPVGDGGFGYDPVFRPARCRKSFAQMSDRQKNRISHRYHATVELARWLEAKSKEL